MYQLDAIIEVYIQIQSSHDFLLRETCPYSELFWSVFSQICTEYKEIRRSLRIQSECGKYGPEQLRIRTLLMRCFYLCYSLNLLI